MDGEKLSDSQQKFIRVHVDIHDHVSVTVYCSIIAMSNHDVVPIASASTMDVKMFRCILAANGGKLSCL